MLYIRKYTSGIPGPSVGILAITHWNEPVWLDVFVRLEDWLHDRHLVGWSLTLIPVNIAAHSHQDLDWNIVPVRYLDADMNRIWKEESAWSWSEFCRRDELYPLINSFDYILDIHSVPEGDFCAGITAPHLVNEISAWCNAPYLLLWATDGAVIGPTIRNGWKGFGLEAWNHLSKHSIERAWDNTLRFLQYTGIVDWTIPVWSTTQRVFQFKTEILPESNSFSFIDQTDEFHRVPQNAIYAIDGAEALRNESRGIVFTGIRNEYATKGKSAGFLFEEIIINQP